MRKWILGFTLCIAALSGGEFLFLERLETAKNGDFIVLEANKTITLLAVRSIKNQKLILEEISAPSQALKKRTGSWADWIQSQAPGHTSWSMMEIDLNDKQIIECYSFSRASWISQQDNLLATLLNLPLTPIQTEQRRKIGPVPQEGEPDHRKIWNPPLIVSGEKLESALFDVFEALWPQDGTELSGKKVSLYFDQQKHSPLPYWIQVESSHATASVRAIDSGKNLPTIFRTLPRRIPEFIAAPIKTKEGIRLSLKSPKYYKEFELFAIDVTSKEKEIHPITRSLTSGQGEILNIDISNEELEQVLQPDHKYTWLVVPTGHSESYTESHKPFLWTPH